VIGRLFVRSLEQAPVEIHRQFDRRVAEPFGDLLREDAFCDQQ
jgi:hypothetical protein